MTHGARISLRLRLDRSVGPDHRGHARRVAGPDAVLLRTPVEHEGRICAPYASFTVAEGERMPFVLRWFPSDEPTTRADRPGGRPREDARVLGGLGGTLHVRGHWHDAVHRSLLTLKALTYAPTGGIVAAPTTSLPEWIGGVRNWDYRYCWLRDATLTLLALIRAGYVEEAGAWRDWLLRAIAGSPEDLQIMYGVAGERRLTEFELPWLGGYEGSQPVRVGNGASDQRQLDVYGEVVDALYQLAAQGPHAVRRRVAADPQDLRLARVGLARAGRGDLGGARAAPALHAFQGHGLGRVRSRCQDDRTLRSRRAARPLEGREEGDQGRGAARGVQRRARRLHAVLRLGSPGRELPLDPPRRVPAGDRRARRRHRARDRAELVRGGFVERYRADEENADIDGLPPGEGVFLPCSFWLAAVLHQQGRRDEAVELYERLLGLRNDLGLISEEYDPERGRLVGNFPQAFTHIGIVETAFTLSTST